jgi:hypothetical protein
VQCDAPAAALLPLLLLSCRDIMRQCTPSMMKWVICIILRDVRVGKSEDAITRVSE